MARRILVVSPHPDDETVGCGGALRLHVLAGAEVRVVFLTSGEAGGHGLGPDETRRTREAEAAAAAAALGLAGIEFWRLPDGRLTATRATSARLSELISTFRPDVIYVPHDGEQHPDHRAAARLVHRATARLDGGAARPRVLMFEVWTPLGELDELVDISPVIDAKLTAIRLYASQCRVLRFDDALAGLARYRGEMHSWPGGDYAEAYREPRW
ncbi:PIG-L deacetylase family protein [Couchioplanes azureus]|uniref:PIG-L deacetylase family protein n=1 Tax=Couchioplanes caeruleus TaxID=56438 RepID=UPI001670A1ED|nr:PIG-L deacetylase family protein [Couchioplanes caeruleus]GGQ75439.1 bacillithiol biosynthesis deacetylase BshB1 [Couchioplanes caeruleus subsp. azureus]